MARNIHGNYYEDNYYKQECQSCKKCFIVGEVLSENVALACPYCQSPCVEFIAASSNETTEDMDMGCTGIYFSRYDDGGLMLYTEREFAAAMKNTLDGGGAGGIPLDSVHRIITDYCTQRDGRGAD